MRRSCRARPSEADGPTSPELGGADSLHVPTNLHPNPNQEVGVGGPARVHVHTRGVRLGPGDGKTRRVSRSTVWDVGADGQALPPDELPCLAGSRSPETARSGAPIYRFRRGGCNPEISRRPSTAASARRRLDKLRSFGKDFVDTFREIPCSTRDFTRLTIPVAIDIDVLAEQNGTCSATCPSGGGA
jgi:hypothetical protein